MFEIDRLKEELHDKFEMKNLEDSWYGDLEGQNLRQTDRCRNHKSNKTLQRKIIQTNSS